MATKQNLLVMLQEKNGQLLSGQQAAARLGVSRAAVWKAAQALRRDGFSIAASAGSGYVLERHGDILSAEAMGLWLPGHPARVLEQTESTNLEAKRWALEGAPHGALVVAASQSGGRGRRGRPFASPPGGLYMSVVLRPRFAAGQAPLVTAAAAVAACRAIQRLCGLEIGIKWVNDLYYKGKKLCGILCESAVGLEAGSLDYIIAGLGINYTTPRQAFPASLRQAAVSLYPGGEAPVPRAQLAAAIQGELLALAHSLAPAEFLPEYRSRSVVLGRPVQVLARPPYTAAALDIDDTGALLVQREDGTRHALVGGEISVRL